MRDIWYFRTYQFEMHIIMLSVDRKWTDHRTMIIKQKKPYLAMTFQDVFGIKVKHLKTFDNLSSFLRAFGLIVMSKEVFAVPFEASL